MELVFLDKVGYLKDYPMYEYHQPSNELIDARIVMHEKLEELKTEGIFFCYKVDDRIRQEHKDAIISIDVIDKTSIGRRKRKKNC
jgi:hypothetical protein